MKSKFLILVTATLGAAATTASGPAHATQSPGSQTVDIGTALSRPNTWTWFENHSTAPMVCLDGTYTGFGYIVPATWNGNVLFLLDGGGYCYDDQSCNKNVLLGGSADAGTVPSLIDQAFLLADIATSPTTHPGTTQMPALFRNHYDIDNFTADATQPGVVTANGDALINPVLFSGVFDTSHPALNPFADYMKVFVPYCTGDLHSGWNADNSSTVTNRVPSKETFYGMIDSIRTFTQTLTAIKSATGVNPPQVVLSGGSAGGVGAEMVYGWLRNYLGPAPSPADGTSGTNIVVIDDGGPLFPAGQSTDGATWTTQGLFGTPPNGGATQNPSSATVSSMEEWWYDAWGGSWTSYYPSGMSYGGYPVIANPLGQGHQPFAPVLPLVEGNWIGSTQPSSLNYGDEFYYIDSTSDWLISLLTPEYQAQSSTPDGGIPIISAYEQIAQDLSLASSSTRNGFFPITSTLNSPGSAGGAITFTNITPWDDHHTFVEDDVSWWNTNSGGSQLQNLWTWFCGAATGPWAGSCDRMFGSPSSTTFTNKRLLVGGMCMDVAGGKPTSGSSIDAYPCWSKPSQQINQLWNFNANGTITTNLSATLCLTMPSTTDNIPLTVTTCNANASNQQWSYSNSNTLVSSGKCANLRGGKFPVAPGTAIIDWECASTPNEVFTEVAPMP